MSIYSDRPTDYGFHSFKEMDRALSREAMHETLLLVACAAVVAAVIAIVCVTM